MNRIEAQSQLLELALHAKELAEALDTGRYDENGDLSYQTALQHLMDHLNLAWHYSQISAEKIAALSPEQFASLTNAIPRLWVDQRLVEPWEKIV